MRLLFVNYEFPPVGGGAAYASIACARELVALGHQIEFLTAGPRQKAGVEEIDGVRVHRIRAYRRGVHESSIFGAASFIALAAGRLRELARRQPYDAYHYYFGLPTGLLSLVPGAHTAHPYVISLRGSDVPGYEPALNRLHRFMLPITRRIWHGAYRVVANSHALRALALMSIAEVPIEVIPNGAAAREQQRPTQAGAGLRILTVSRLIARKDIDTLIRALARCRRTDLSLDIVGEGPRREQLAQLAFACGVADRVRFHGFMNRTRLDAMYGRADLFVLTSEAESCSMALLEAMAAGLPLVATKVGGTVELIESGHNGLLVEAGDAEQLGTALDRLAEDPAERERFSAANRALVRERFSWRSTARQYERVFEQALAQHAGASAQAAWGGGRERK